MIFISGKDVFYQSLNLASYVKFDFTGAKKHFFWAVRYITLVFLIIISSSCNEKYPSDYEQEIEELKQFYTQRIHNISRKFLVMKTAIHEKKSHAYEIVALGAAKEMQRMFREGFPLDSIQIA